MRDRAVYIISVAAELAGVHPQTMRTYERKGLLNPHRTSGGTRRYSERDITRVQLIQELTQGQGINLAGVAHILELYDTIEMMRRELAQAHHENQALRSEAERRVRHAETVNRSEIVLYSRGEIEPRR